MQEAGLSIREDPMGNIFGRWEGADPKLGAFCEDAHFFVCGAKAFSVVHIQAPFLSTG